MPESPLQKFLSGIGGAALMGVHLVMPFLHGYLLYCEGYHMCWGVTGEELGSTWLGDALVPPPRGGLTHGITIRALASRVWPWVAQIGQGKGGFYSYEFLEDLVGCEIHNADRLVPEW
jgi:hypothetical protein